jgi:hypothetical protein
MPCKLDESHRIQSIIVALENVNREIAAGHLQPLEGQRLGICTLHGPALCCLEQRSRRDSHDPPTMGLNYA